MMACMLYIDLLCYYEGNTVNSTLAIGTSSQAESLTNLPQAEWPSEDSLTGLTSLNSRLLTRLYDECLVNTEASHFNDVSTPKLESSIIRKKPSVPLSNDWFCSLCSSPSWSSPF